ncbi:MAG TPA: J domain-containing protein [Candidatus Limnocylindrales bacterium]
MAKRDPHLVLGVGHDASDATIKAAWRRLAREHHPDLAGEDAGQARRATRRMAEINDAYQELQDPDRRRAWREAAATGRPPAPVRRAAGRPDERGRAAEAERPGEPARSQRGPARQRPVTARVDTTELFRPRNSVLEPRPGSPLPGWQPRPRESFHQEAPRASDPTGPAQRRRGKGVRPILPSLEDALATELRFGKFHGHTLGEIAGFEPSYVDWIVRTLADPELVGAARVVQAALDRAGIVRRRPGERPGERLGDPLGESASGRRGPVAGRATA